jgi:CubicO group peptidase (beta-lactamase class C family)
MRRAPFFLAGWLLLACGSAVFPPPGEAGRLLTGAAPALGVAPMSPAVERAVELLEVVTGGDHGAMEAYVDHAFAPDFMRSPPREAHLNFMARLRDGTGGLRIETVAASAPDEATVIYHTPLTGEWHELRVQVEPQAPHRITRLDPPRGAPPPRVGGPEPRELTDAQAAVELHAYVRRLADADVFSGSVLVARRGAVVFESAYGAASREFGAANAPDTRFIIGSVNKMFTAVALLQMMEQGRLSLEDPVEMHLPGVLPEDIARRVRIEHLLTHTSGLGDFLFTPEMMRRSRADFRNIADYLSQLAEARLRFEPGAGWWYSNAGFLLLGAIVEAVSGQGYDEYVAEHVFGPAGMTATGAPELDLVPVGLASTYQREFAGGRPRFRSDRYMQPVRGTPAGGGFSTAADLNRFMQALHANRLLSPETTRLMLSPKPELGSNLYGLGAQMFAPEAQRVGHTGGGPGTSARVELDLENELVIVILGNQNTGSSSVHRRIRQLFTADPPTQAW